MQKTLDNYGAGIQVTQVQLQKVDPPTQVIDSFRDVQAARADLERAQNEAQTYANRVVPEARGRAAQITQSAEAYREQTVAEARGQTARFLSVYEEYKKAPEVTRQRMYLETMERLLGGTRRSFSTPAEPTAVVASCRSCRSISSCGRSNRNRRRSSHSLRPEVSDETQSHWRHRCRIAGRDPDRRLCSIFTVYQTRQAIVVRLGRADRGHHEPGLHFKVPLIDSVIHIDKRILDLENPAQEVIASDQKRLVVDAFARYKITDPLLFYQTVSTVEGANSRLSTLLNSALRRVLGESTLTHVVRDERPQLMAKVREQLEHEAKDFGIEVVDVRIRRADLPEQNSQAVYQRMQTERQREAAEFRAQGSQRAQEIRARADRDVTVLLAEAHGEGRADPRRRRRRAQPHLRRCLRPRSGFLRVLSRDAGLRGGTACDDTRMLLKPDSDFFRYFVDPSGKRPGTCSRAALRRPRPAERSAPSPEPCPANAAAEKRPKHHARFHRGHRSGARHRRTDLRRLSRGGKAAGGECAGNAGRVVASGRRRVGGDRRADRVAGARLVEAG